ncbi:hypothetical protein CCR90_08405 [Rhodovulum sulfidophilum]|uniref:hypothetical protein n=1 Tax=Rhodovulum sulfidophilum TaxID=35806 RepID=UPI0019123E90|nr:hypothetical protein [Rhodovulum sulfidophilum]MBK5923800.1 hypothetical protein [Rhodovulum sulfidophilum]
MQELTTQIRDWWGVMLSLLGLAVWSVRLEARARTNTTALDRETARLGEEIRALEARWQRQRAEDLAARQRDREETNALLRELRADIKTVLQRVPR